jgi:hypothetical protein
MHRVRTIDKDWDIKMQDNGLQLFGYAVEARKGRECKERFNACEFT